MVVAPAPARAVRLLVPLAALALALTLPAPSGADHVQTTPTGAPVSAQFDHGGDNAWWVEVEVRAVAGQLENVHAQVEGSATLQPMKAVANDATRQSQGWVKFAPQQAFNVPAGARVMFWAGMTDGANKDTVLSCWFTHPAGVEQCTSSTSSMTATGPSTTSSSSSTTSSASTTSTSSSPPPFDATFTGVRGNEWWVQAQVGTNGPGIAKVDVRQNVNGAWQVWQPVTKQSWGWGSSYHIVQGTIVQLRATATTGQSDVSSCRQWIPPANTDATIVTCPSTPPPGFDAHFSGVKGNEWWVQTNVAANMPVAGVSARVDCATEWTPLTKQSWGGWAASFHVPAGSRVDFQARTSTWLSDVSGGYGWTAAGPVAPCPQGDWPRQGSTATYRMDSGVCGGGECEHSTGRMHLTYDQGRWLGHCTATDRYSAPDGRSWTRTWSSDHVGLPPPWESPRTWVNNEHRPDMFRAGFGQSSCSMGWSSSPVYVTGTTTRQVTLESRGTLTLDAWEASSRDEVDNLWIAHWDRDTGLVLDVSSNPRMSGQGSASMQLIDTNMPLR